MMTDVANNMVKMSKFFETKFIFIIVIIMLSICHVALIYKNVILTKDIYTYGDWLISYAGGFVRRGLGGEILIFISNLFGDHLGATTFVLLSALSVATLAGLYQLLRDRLTWIDMALLISPAGLLFPVLAPGNAGKKDTIVLSLMVLGGVLLSAATRMRRPSELSLGLFAMLLATTAFIHESVIFYAPALVSLFFLEFAGKGHPRRGLLLCGGILLGLAAILVIISGSTKLKPEVVSAICDRVNGAAPVNCREDGAIWWLQNDTAYFITQGREMWASGVYPGIYLVGWTMGLAYLYFFSSAFQLSATVRAHLPPAMHPVQLHIAAFGLATIPLYVVAIDWGRWFSLWYTLAMLYCLIGEALGVVSRRAERATVRASWTFALAVASLSFLWALPLCCHTIPSLAEKLLLAFS
jgi:hypothetical protein